MRRPKEKEDDEFDSMEHHLREKSSREMTSSRNCELRFNLNLRSKTEMSDGAELGFLEVRLCLTLSEQMFGWECSDWRA